MSVHRDNKIRLWDPRKAKDSYNVIEAAHEEPITHLAYSAGCIGMRVYY